MEPARFQLDALSQRLRALEERWRPHEGDGQVQTVEVAAGSLRRRRLHEWLGVDEIRRDLDHGQKSQAWTPAVAVLMDAAAQAWRDSGGLVVWIGRAVWPYAVSLPAAVAADSVLIDPAPGERLWAIDLALRSQAATAVVADGSGLSLRATRRLQLAAEAGRALGLLARPGHEASHRSAAAYRWMVRRVPVEMSSIQREQRRQEHDPPRWEVELLRGKDAAAVPRAAASSVDETGEMGRDVSRESVGLKGTGVTWSRQATRRIVEWRHEGLVVVPAVVVDPAAPAKPGIAGGQQVRRGA